MLEVLIYLRWWAKRNLEAEREKVVREIDELLDCLGEASGKDLKRRLRI